MTTPTDLPALEAELNRIISMRGETATSGRVLNVCADLAKAMKDMVRIFVKEEGK